MAKPRPPAPHRGPLEQYLFARAALDGATAALRMNVREPAKRRRLFEAHCNTARRRFTKAKAAALAANLDLQVLEREHVARHPVKAVGQNAVLPPVRRADTEERPATAPPVVARQTRPARPKPLDALTLFDPDTFGRTVWIFPTGSTFHRSDCQTVVHRDGAKPVDVADARRYGMTRCRHCVPSQWN